MRVDRELLLQKLESVDAGLALKEVVEQSSCFVFCGGNVVTFSGEVSVRAECFMGKDIEGAVSAKHLKELLSRLRDDDIDIDIKDGKMKIRSKTGKGFILFEKEVALPVDQIEEPGEWTDLDPEFCDAVALVQKCAAKDDNNYRLTCVHITPHFVEACDNYQVARYAIETGLTEKSMIKKESIKHVVALGMTEVSETETWLHFRNPNGLVLSCRRWTDEYDNLDPVLENKQGDPITLPGGLAETININQVFSDDNGEDEVVRVRIKKGMMEIRGESAQGVWDERKKVKYTGKPLAFCIAPGLLAEISEETHECTIGATSLRIDNGKFEYVTCLEEQ
jgi:DNA polymerase III sliding clamp (beta) subunit (PCNA family)